MEGLDTKLEELGAFEAGAVVVVGENTAALEVAGLFEARGQGARVIGLPDPAAHGESGRPISLRDAAGDDPEVLSHSGLVIAVSTTADVVQELLSTVRPLCRILAIGRLGGAMPEVDLYGTIHRNDLELTRIRLED